MIANHILANHKAKTRNRQYTAIFAVWSIPALIRYYDIFKSIDHDLNIAAIFSYGANEDGEGKEEHSRDALERIIADYNKTYDTNYNIEKILAAYRERKDIRQYCHVAPISEVTYTIFFLGLKTFLSLKAREWHR